MSNPTISVIIPAYNVEKTIKRTIDSVLKQTFSDWEIIIINDGSTDSTVEIISQISSTKLSFISCSNTGLPAATRNRGLELANGEYIAFLDADDLWSPDKLELQLKAMLANPQAGLAYSWTDLIDEKDQFIDRGNYISGNGNVYNLLLLVNFIENGSNPLIRRQALDKVGYFDESVIKGTEDWDLWLRLAKDYEFVCVNSPQVLYRISSNSLSSNLARQEEGCLKVINNGFDRFPELPSILHNKSLANLYIYLSRKAMQGYFQWYNLATAIKYFKLAFNLAPFFTMSRIPFKLLLTLTVILKLSPQQTYQFLTIYKKFFKLYEYSIPSK